MYIKIKISHLIVGMVLVSSMLWAGIVLAGEPDSPGEPGATSSYSLEDLYQRLSAGTVGSSSVFTEPITVPGVGTMHSLNEIMAVAPALDNTNGATMTQVISGTTFWSLTSGQWGVQTGTLVTAAVPLQSAVPKTGQTNCSNASGTIVSCSGTGQDGEYQVGTAGVLMPTTGITGTYLTAPSWTGTRFTDNGDGTVQDNLTGLIWLKQANCYGLRSWATALTDANSLSNGSCGLSDGSSAGDWRLPNVNELHSLIDLSQTNPALPSGHPFTDVQLNPYWSSSTRIDNTSYAWLVTLGTGYVDSSFKLAFTHYVWPVRGGQ